MWTLPELLLSKPGEIRVYFRGEGTASGANWRVFSKNKQEIGNLAWNDSKFAMQMIDHFNGTIHLSRLELVKVFLQCLWTRQRAHGPPQALHYPGDLSYILMGLLRRRPEAVPSDSAFLAFARLSFANDTDRLLERMISVLPAASRGGTPEDWLMADDHWGANL
jgi:hypothetical protein